MTHVLPSVELFLLAWFVFIAVGSVVSSMIVRALRSQLGSLEPRARHRALGLLAALPLLIAGTLMLSATLPSLLSLELPGFDHCATHNDGHPHLCFVHLPRTGVNVLAAGSLIAVAAYLLARASIAAARLIRATRILEVLARTGAGASEADVTLIESSMPVCMTAGLFAPRILISRGLFAALADDEREIVLAHERAHVRRRDALISSLARILAFAHLPAARRWILEELDVAAEQACDEEAARLAEDRVAVASVILSVERAARHAGMASLAPVAVGFGQCATERRVESLLADPTGPRSLAPIIAAFAAAVCVLMVASGQLHHLIESVLFTVAY